MFLLPTCFGCGNQENENDFVLVGLQEFPCQNTDELGVWESTPGSNPDCPWFPYDSNTTYVFPHTLQREPRGVLPYIAFDRLGIGATLASGNPVILIDQSDTSVVLRNAQNQDFWIRLVLF